MKKSEILMERINARIEVMNILEEDAHYLRLAKKSEISDKVLSRVSDEKKIATELIECYNLMFKSKIKLEPLEDERDDIRVNWTIWIEKVNSLTSL